jgi:guanylate kinase
MYPAETLTIFIKVPTMEELETRLRKRGTDTEESLRKRLAKAEYELTFESKFDVVLINDDLDTSLKEAEAIVRKFIL